MDPGITYPCPPASGPPGPIYRHKAGSVRFLEHIRPDDLGRRSLTLQAGEETMQGIVDPKHRRNFLRLGSLLEANRPLLKVDLRPLQSEDPLAPLGSVIKDVCNIGQVLGLLVGSRIVFDPFELIVRDVSLPPVLRKSLDLFTRIPVDISPSNGLPHSMA